MVLALAAHILKTDNVLTYYLLFFFKVCTQIKKLETKMYKY